MLQSFHRDEDSGENSERNLTIELSITEAEDLVSAVKLSNDAIAASSNPIIGAKDGFALDYRLGFPVMHVLLGSGLIPRLPAAVFLAPQPRNIAYNTILHSAIAMDSSKEAIARLVSFLPTEAFFMEDGLDRTPLLLAFIVGNEFAASAILDRFSDDLPQLRRLLRDEGQVFIDLASRKNFSYNIFDKITTALSPLRPPLLWSVNDTQPHHLDLQGSVGSPTFSPVPLLGQGSGPETIGLQLPKHSSHFQAHETEPFVDWVTTGMSADFDSLQGFEELRRPGNGTGSSPDMHSFDSGAAHAFTDPRNMQDTTSRRGNYFTPSNIDSSEASLNCDGGYNGDNCLY